MNDHSKLLSLSRPIRLSAARGRPVWVAMTAMLLAACGGQSQTGNAADEAEATAARIRPVAQVTLKVVQKSGEPKTGEQVFNAQCSACHATGAAGAPKKGDAAAWAPRIGQGLDLLVTHALKGKGAMGPQGGGAHSDYEVARAVVYMANAGGAKFTEPKAPAAAPAP